MTDSEFFQWWDDYNASFLSFGRWLADRHGPVEGEASKRILKKWRSSLRHTELQDALAATAQLVEAATRYPDYGSHPYEVRRIAETLRRRREQPPPRRLAEGEPTYVCQLCEDTGVVESVWSEISKEAAREGRLGERFTDYTCAKACTCSAGDRQERAGMQRFDVQRDLIRRCLPSVEAECDELRRFVAR